MKSGQSWPENKRNPSSDVLATETQQTVSCAKIKCRTGKHQLFQDDAKHMVFLNIKLHLFSLL